MEEGDWRVGHLNVDLDNLTNGLVSYFNNGSSLQSRVSVASIFDFIFIK